LTPCVGLQNRGAGLELSARILGTERAAVRAA
jgi:hypothetical protein